MQRRALALTLLTLASLAYTARAEDDTSADAAARDQKFCDMLSGVTLVGSFTVTYGEGSGPLGDDALKEDRYRIEKVTKGKNDYFLFEARIQYQGKDQVFRMPVEVKWAGDTPVITLTKVLVPGLGTFSARVLFYEDHYAGFWGGGDHGGHMFGRIERDAPGGEESKPEDKASDK